MAKDKKCTHLTPDVMPYNGVCPPCAGVQAMFCPACKVTYGDVGVKICPYCRNPHGYVLAPRPVEA